MIIGEFGKLKVDFEGQWSQRALVRSHEISIFEFFFNISKKYIRECAFCIMWLFHVIIISIIHLLVITAFKFATN